MNQKEESFKLLRQIEKNVYHQQTLIHIADIYMRLGVIRKAEENLKKAVLIEKKAKLASLDGIDVRFRLALVYARQGQYKKSLRFLKYQYFFERNILVDQSKTRIRKTILAQYPELQPLLTDHWIQTLPK